MNLRTVYLQRLLSINGREALRGRVLYDRFRQLSEEALLGHMIYRDEVAAGITDSRIKPDIISQSLLRDFRPNVVYVEGGLFLNNEGVWKIPRDIASEICESGGVVIVADIDVNQLREHKSHYRQASQFFKASGSYGTYDEGEPIYGADERRFWKGSRQILCDPTKMVLSDWLRPIYNGIPEILVGLPCRLTSFESIAASCNSDTTGTLQSDSWVDASDACPFAAAAQVGHGFAVLIAGNVSADVWLEGCQHNSQWLTNLASFLVDTAATERTRRMSYRRSVHTLFLSHRSTDLKLVSAVSNAIKRGGVNVWLDEEQLVPSQSLVMEINRAIGKMTHFVLFWSSHCLGAPWVERELSAATARLVEQSIPIFIVRLDTTPVPPILTDLFRIEAREESAEAIGERLVNAVEQLARRPVPQ